VIDGGDNFFATPGFDRVTIANWGLWLVTTCSYPPPKRFRGGIEPLDHVLHDQGGLVCGNTLIHDD
jgi:hypothetical protein